MSTYLADVFSRREADAVGQAASATTPLLRNVHLRMAAHYRRLAADARDDQRATPPVRL